MTPIRVGGDELADWIRARAVGADRFLFGLAGSPGSGKSTLASTLADDLGAVVVPMDGYHLPNAVLDEGGVRHVKGAPHTFAADEFVAAVTQLRAGDEVVLPAFDRVTDEPVAGRIRVPVDQRIVIVEGNYLLLDTQPWAELVELLDAVGHIEIDAAVRVRRLVARHVEFGKSPAAATAFVEQSDEVNAALVEAVARRADVLVTVE